MPLQKLMLKSVKGDAKKKNLRDQHNHGSEKIQITSLNSCI